MKIQTLLIKRGWLGFVASVTGLLCTQSHAQISGKTYDDFASNGVQDASDPGLGGVKVTLYGSDGTSCGTTTSLATGTTPAGATEGDWLITPSGSAACTAGPWRVEFSNLPAGYQPGGGTTSTNGGSVQFVTGAQPVANVKFGAFRPIEYCQNEPLLCAVTIRGNAATAAANPNANYTLLRFPYASGTTTNTQVGGAQDTPDPTGLANSTPFNQVGSVFGVAWHRYSKRVFTSAFVKNHAGLANGTGQIYAVDATGAATPYVNLDTILGPGTTGPAGAATVAGTSYTAALTPVLPLEGSDTNTYKAAGKAAFGGIKIIEDSANPLNDRLFVVSLYDRKLYSIPTSGALTNSTITGYAIPGTTSGLTTGSGVVKGCPVNDVRPFGLGRFQNNLYVGVVCSAQSTNLRSDMRAYVFKFDTTANAFSTNAVIEYSLDYQRQYAYNAPYFGFLSSNWVPWTDDFRLNNAGGTLGAFQGNGAPATPAVDYASCPTVPAAGASALSNDNVFRSACPGYIGHTIDGVNSLAYPSPLIGDIEFDGVGTMVIGMRDRFADQFYLRDPYTAATAQYKAWPAGDLLRAPRLTADTWNGAAADTSFYDTAHPSHEDVAQGGVVQVPGRGDVVAAVYDPAKSTDDFQSNGIKWLDNSNGSALRQYRVNDVEGTSYTGANASAFTSNTFGKGNGMGDIEKLCDVAPIEIGNRIWKDSNGNGIQDPGEAGIARVAVELWADTDADSVVDTKVGVAITDANGQYYFGNIGNTNMLSKVANPSAVTDFYSVNPLTKYEIRVNTVGAAVPATVVGNGTPSGTSVSQTTGNATLLAGLPLTTTNAPQAANANASDATNNATTDVADSDATAGAGAAVGGGTAATMAVIPYTTQGPGFNNHSLDIGFKSYSIGDLVWQDNNKDGKKDTGETPISGAVLELYAANAAGAPIGSTLATVTTDATGRYRFDGLAAGDYVVVAKPGAGYSSSPGTAVTASGANTSTNELDNGSDTAIATGNPGAGGFPSGKITLGATNPTGESNAAAPVSASVTTLEAPDAQSNRTVDFGFYQPTYAIGNRVWFDTNNNGTIDASEGAVAGVKVELLNSSGVIVSTTVTDANGFYLFDNLTAGSYQVKIPADNWTGITAASGVPVAAETSKPLAGYSNSTGATAEATPFTGANNNKDHGVDNATPATSGITSGTIAVGPTGANGSGEASEVISGTAPISQAGDINDNLNVDFGFYRLTVGNLVWKDDGTSGGTANDGIRNGSEPVIVGVTVQLVNSGGTVVAQTVTGAGGTYTFDQQTSVPAIGVAGTPNGQPLAAGNYTVRIPGGQSVLANLASSADPAGGGQPVGDSRDNGTGAVLTSADVNSATISLKADGTLPQGATPSNGTGTTAQTNMDFGFTPTYSIGNRVFLDTGAGSGVRNDGIRNGSEPGIPNVRMNLLDNSGAQLYLTPGGALSTSPVGNTAIFVLTDVDGYYRFDGLPAGNYIVEAVGSTLPAGTVSSTGTQANDSGDKGADVPVGGNYRSTVVAVGPGLQPLTEGDIVASGLGAQGPNGDPNTNSTIDFGFVAPIYAIGNRIWFDTNNNGTVDAGETGSAGVKVELLNSANAVVGTTLTDANGFYLFDTIGAGTYSVRVSQDNWTGITAASGVPASAVGTKPLVGYANSTGVTNASATVAAVDNNKDHGTDNATPATAGGITSGSISVGSPTPASGVGTGDTTEVGATTPAATNAGDANDNLTVDFGFYRLAVGNQIFVDTNADSVYTPGVDGAPASVQNIGVELRDAGTNAVIATTTTGPTGAYEFVSLSNGNPIPPGSYYVSLPVLPAGSKTVPVGTALTDNNSQGRVPAAAIPGVAVKTPTVTLAVGSTAQGQTLNSATGTTLQPTLDMGFAASYSVGNRVWVDANNNGTLDAGEQGLNGVTVNLRDGNGAQLYRTPTGALSVTAAGNTAITMPTAGGGYYLFKDLPAGTYVVEIQTPLAAGGQSYVSSTGSNGSTTGPYEPAGAGVFASGATDHDHGVQFAANTMRSRPLTLGPAQPTGEDGNATPGNTDTTPDDQSNLTVDFGVFVPATLGNFVWTDTNRNGTADSGEPGINGVVVSLRDASTNALIASTITSDRPAGHTSGQAGPGWYQFTNVTPGSYVVEFSASGFVSTPSGTPAVTSGSPPERNTNQLAPGVSTGRTATITVVAGDNNPQLDAGFVEEVRLAVPTMGEWAMMLMSMLLAGMGAGGIQRQRLRSMTR